MSDQHAPMPTTRRLARGSRRGFILVAILVVLINLPILHVTYTNWRVDQSGQQVTAQVVEARVSSPDDDPHYWLGIRFPEDIDPDQSAWPVEVDRATYDAALEAREIEARVLPSNPAAYEVEGEVHSRLGFLTTLIADAVLLLILLLVWRFGRRARVEPLRLAATGDVERCPPGGVVEALEGDLYLVRGEVVAIDEGELVLDVGDQEVVVILDGHHNPVGYQQPAQVRGRVVE
jgi:hypothetical protein